MSLNQAGGRLGLLCSMIAVREAALAALLASVLCALACYGCAPRITEAPPTPSAGLMVQTDSGSRGRAQAVWIGNRILTAAHVLIPDFDNPVLRTEFWLNGEMVRVLHAESGDPHALARGYSQQYALGTTPDPSDWIEDWVVAEVSKSAPAPAALRLCDRPIRSGDRLYAVGFPPHQDRPHLQALPLTAIDFNMEEQWKQNEATIEALKRLVAVQTPIHPDLSGWSGSFVGRYHRGKWCYVGLLISGVDPKDGKSAGIVLRPPPQAIRMLLGQDTLENPPREN